MRISMQGIMYDIGTGLMFQYSQETLPKIVKMFSPKIVHVSEIQLLEISSGVDRNRT